MLLSSCGQDREEGKLIPPAQVQLAAFRDIPFPNGYSPDPGSDQLAVAYGDVSVRYMDITYLQGNDELSLAAEELQSWYADRLKANGWENSEAIGDGGLGQMSSWVQQTRSEELLLETGLLKKKGIIRVRIKPQK